MTDGDVLFGFRLCLVGLTHMLGSVRVARRAHGRWRGLSAENHRQERSCCPCPVGVRPKPVEQGQQALQIFLAPVFQRPTQDLESRPAHEVGHLLASFAQSHDARSSILAVRGPKDEAALLEVLNPSCHCRQGDADRLSELRHPRRPIVSHLLKNQQSRITHVNAGEPARMFDDFLTALPGFLV